MKKLIALIVAITTQHAFAGANVWISWYNRYESAYYMGAHSELDWKWVASRPSYTSSPRYWLTTWNWVNGTIQPGYPTTSYAVFPTSFDNVSMSYWSDNGNTLVNDSTTSNVSVRADAQGATIRFYLTANLIAEEGYFLQTLRTYKDIVVAPNATYYGNPFVGYNYNNGTLNWIILR